MAKKLPKDVVLPTTARSGQLFPDDFGTYPTQTRRDHDPSKVGEFRGFYHTIYKDKKTKKYKVAKYWRPKSSQFGGRSGGGHSGIDIFAPPNRFPLQTPVVAIGDGDLTFRADAITPNDIGNMATLVLIKRYDGYEVRFLYGHLSRFHGADQVRGTKGRYITRKVKKGDLIGYAGCTGNANDGGECTSLNGDWGVSSGHVHLVAELIGTASKTVKGKPARTTNRVDPAKLLGWDLAFEGDKSYRDLEYWKANLKPEAPFAPEMEKGRVKAISKARRRRKNGLRRPLPPPYETLEFDHSRSIRRSLRAYEQLKQRLPKSTSAKVKAAKARYFASHEDIADHIAEVFDPAVVALKAAKSGAAFGGPLLRAVVAAEYCLWHLMGGAAFGVLASNRARGSLDGVKNLIECGPGVGGRAALVGMDAVQSSLHLARFRLTDEKGAKRLINVCSISFGAGSLMHATLSQDAEDDLEEKHPKASAYLSGVFVTAAEIGKLHGSAVRDARRLAVKSILASNSARKKIIARLARVRATILSASEPLDASDLGKRLSQKDLTAMMKQMLVANIAAFDLALKVSGKKEGKTPIAPHLSALRLAKGKS